MNKKKLYNALYKVVLKDELRPVLGCVFHSNGCVVASNGHMLAEVQYPNYNPDLEGKIINRYGAELDKDFPNYKTIIPDITKMTELRDEFIYNNLLKAARNVILTDFDRINNVVVIELNGFLLAKTNIIKAFKVINALDERLTIYTGKPNQGVVLKTEHITCVIMPVDQTTLSPEIKTHFYTIPMALNFQRTIQKQWFE